MKSARFATAGVLCLVVACNQTREQTSEAARDAPSAEPAAPAEAKAADAPARPASASTENVSVLGPWVWATPNPRLAAAYFTLKNPGTKSATLLSVSGDAAARIELHESVEEDGIVRMVPHPEGFEVPAGGELELERGGKHAMLIGLTAPLEAGATVKLTLSLSEGRKLDVDFPVREATEPEESE